MQFSVIEREPSRTGGQYSYDVIDDNGKVIRASLWFDYATADCALLNACVNEGWSTDEYHSKRAECFSNLRG